MASHADLCSSGVLAAAMEQFKKGMLNEGDASESLAAAETAFVREASASVPGKTGWGFKVTTAAVPPAHARAGSVCDRRPAAAVQSERVAFVCDRRAAAASRHACAIDRGAALAPRRRRRRRSPRLATRACCPRPALPPAAPVVRA